MFYLNLTSSFTLLEKKYFLGARLIEQKPNHAIHNATRNSTTLFVQHKGPKRMGFSSAFEAKDWKSVIFFYVEM